MGQSKATLVLPADQVTRINELLLNLENELVQLTAMQPQQRQRLFKMGPGSEVFARRALEALEQNPDIIPPSLAAELPGAKADLQGIDQLRPILDRLNRLCSRASDTEMALGSDVMNVALEGYNQLKVSGRDKGLDALRNELGVRFKKGQRRGGKVPEPA
ncbi:hypothetical protein ARC78_07385 [Stenotrophomonas pictorum JCM 9942]|uniref:Uncharacterized protein n=1 Tax=Stenotrophomonas pictorum JCM 9942 TaxID=1236960 RepID=A0A0R0AP72_9GAMM|nr:hypothetical protein [Stenotrophomonas pictorum]KRG43438.1 hypothetical protein ARC78_07385 [Stenotrophomonas pictorum JCM 9942]